MKKCANVKLLRIYVGEDDQFEGKKLYLHILDWLRANRVAGATVLRGIAGFGKSSHLHTASILRLSSDLPIVIEVVDYEENIKKIKDYLVNVVKAGLITEENVKIILYEGSKQG